MHVHALRFAALGPFAGEHVIDFDGLGGSALFLIDGPTGAGKSSIIDAIVFALYGDVAGRSSDKQRLRSSFAAPGAESFAEVEFTTSFGRFRVWRSPEYDRPKIRGTGTTPQASKVTLSRSTGPEGWEVVSTRHGEVEAEISRVIGLTRQQFLQTVVLPQGEFATFLAADSADRLVVLERIFATDVYSRVEGILEDRRRLAQAARDAADGDVTRAVLHVRGRLPDADLARVDLGSVEVTASDPEADGGVAILAVLAEVVARAEQQFIEHDRAVVEHTGAVSQLTVRVTALEARQAAAQRVAAAHAALDTERSDHLTAVTDLDAHATVIASLSADPAEPPALQAALERVGGQLDAARTAADRLAADTASRDRLLDSLRAQEERLVTLQAERDVDLPARLMELALALERALSQAARAADAKVKAEAELVAARLDGMAAELAAGLDDGRPCPVCGAEHHPDPAVRTGPSVTPADLAAARTARTRAEEAHHALELERVRVEGLADDLAGAEPGPTDGSDAPPTTISTAGDIAAAVRSLQIRIGEIDAAITSAVEKREAGRRDLASLETAIAHGTAIVDAARGDYSSLDERSAAMAALRRALESVATATSRVAAAESALSAAETEWEALGAAPDGDLAGLRAERSAAADALRVATSARDASEDLVADLRGRVRDVEESVGARDRCRADTADVIALAHVVRGGPGNALAQPLSAYVVQTMFDEILVSANRRLRAMLDGRFELRATESRTGRRLGGLGLGLEVLDLRTETLRRTSTLSGGETFCASLALALGLADTVRAHAGGVEIGMLIIDEGFGSLDGERLDEVMAELLQLRADGRTVGVISHVAEMKRTILERIDVRPVGAREGSTLSVSWID